MKALIERLHGEAILKRSALRLPGGEEVFRRVLAGKGYRSALEIISLFKLFREIYEFDTLIRGSHILGSNGNNISEADGRFNLRTPDGEVAERVPEPRPGVPGLD